MARNLIQVRLIVVLLLTTRGVQADFDFKINPAYDVFLLRDSQLELNCTVNNSSADVNLMYFGLNCTTRANGLVQNCTEIPDRFLTRLEDDSGSRTLMLRKPDVSLEDRGMYVCAYGNPAKTKSFKKVNIGDLPGKPENLTCISNDYNDMSCSAFLPIRPYDIPMKWTMKYKVDGENSRVNCTVLNNAVLCYKDEIFSDQTYTITVEGWNKIYGASVEENFVLYSNYSIVKPGPVTEPQVHFQNISTEVILNWSLSEHLFAYGMVLIHRIELVSLQQWAKPRTMNIKFNFDEPLTFKLTELIPNANYSVSITCKPNSAQGEQYWSEPVEATFKTHIDIPGQSVDLVPGSYSYTSANDSKVDIILYWKNPSARESHGDIERYKIEVTEQKPIQYKVNDTIIQGQFNITVDALSAAPSFTYQQVVVDEIEGIHETKVLESFNETSAYTMKIWAGNEAGYSESYAEVSIPTSNRVKELQPSWVCVEEDIDLGRTRVTWDIDATQEDQVANMTVYSCEAEPLGELLLCKNFNWYRQTFVKKEIWIWIDESRDHNFAVSLETDNGLSGGMVWQSLQFTYDRVPDRPTYSVIADPSNHTVLYITVTHGGLPSYGKPQHYEIVWEKQDVTLNNVTCPTDVKLQYPVDFSRTYLVLFDLQPGTGYVVCMRSKNVKGQGMFGQPLVIRTSESPVVLATKSGTDENLFVIFGSIGGVILLIIFLGICIFCVKRKIKKLKINTRIEDVYMDHFKFDNVRDEKYSETKEEVKPEDHDSGKGSTASSTTSQNQQDSGEGFPQTAPWSLVSSGESRYYTPRNRNSSSSGLSGYFRVDGPNSGLSVGNGNENDSLIDNDDNDDDTDANLHGETNDYFSATERGVNVYHDIVDIPEPQDDVNSLVTGGDTALSVSNEEDTVYTDDVPPLSTNKGDTSLRMRDGDKAVLDVMTRGSYLSNDKDTSHEKNEYVPNGYSQNTAVELSEKSKIDENAKPMCQNTTSCVSKYSSEYVAEKQSIDNAKGLDFSEQDYEDGTKNERQSLSTLNEINDSNITVSNDFTLRLKQESADNQYSFPEIFTGRHTSSGEYTVRALDDSDDNYEEPMTHGIYHNPETISLGLESLSSENSAPQNVVLTDEFDKDLDSNSVSEVLATKDEGFAKDIQLSKHDDNNDSLTGDRTSTGLALEKMCNGFQINSHLSMQSQISNNEDNSVNESGRSLDTYVCAAGIESV